MAWLVLGLLMAISAALRLELVDTLDPAWRRMGIREPDECPSGKRVLFNPPPSKHLIAIPLLLYKAAFEGFGISSYVPYRLAHIALLLLCAGLSTHSPAAGSATLSPFSRRRSCSFWEARWSQPRSASQA